jgi:nucleotide-binding universal stress UspA family protein
MKTGRNKILVAIDFEEQSLNALEHSFELAGLFEADLVLLYVIEVSNVFGKIRSPDEYVKKIIQEAREKFDELEKLARSATSKASVKTSVIIEKGKPYDKIIETAIDQEVIMIVMGKNSISSLTKRNKYIGSNTMNVVREAECPVITIKEKTKIPGKFSRILLPLDFTRQTKKQVQKAIEFGGYFGAKIYVVSINTNDNKVAKLLKQVQLNQVKNAIQRNGVSCHTESLFSKDETVSDMVISYSNKIDADLIIIMTQQKKSFVNYYIGSNAQEIIFNSTIPVLSIIPTAEFKPGVVTSMVDPLGLIKKKIDEDPIDD